MLRHIKAINVFLFGLRHLSISDEKLAPLSLDLVYLYSYQTRWYSLKTAQIPLMALYGHQRTCAAFGCMNLFFCLTTKKYFDF